MPGTDNASSSTLLDPPPAAVIDAWKELMAIGLGGERLQPGAVILDDPRPSNGRIFTTTVRVLDSVRKLGRKQYVDGTLRLGVANLDPWGGHSDGERTLGLHSELAWKTSTGREHRSSAQYDIYEIAAGFLAEIPDPDLSELTDDAIEELVERSATYHAIWTQRFPGWERIQAAAWNGMLDHVDPVIRADALYHEQAIIHLDTDSTCMLADDDIGVVFRNELPTLLRVVQELLAKA
ncbi:MAG TPA: hypothetical protein VLF91_05135 [Candidatus Saccharimonadales bacterium]|nr:hypothetical protein [Candidatus Saccharimonadales bacterium]